MGQSLFSASLYSAQAILGGVADMLEGWAAAQRALDRLEKGTNRNFMKFKKVKSRVLHLE